jgi:purine-cytosine permease-like protein
MDTETIAVFIPIIFILVTGLILITYFFLRSRERQLLIDKGLSADQIKQFFENKKDQFWLLKIGIIAIAFGISLGTGMMLEDATSKDYWVPLSLFTITGIGFIAANLVSRKLETDVK